jgi:hypothetical protein
MLVFTMYLSCYLLMPPSPTSCALPQQLHEWAEMKLKKMQDDEEGISTDAFQVIGGNCRWGGGG